jgi:hypothetical protein
MSARTRTRLACCVLAICALSVGATGVRADVTVEEQSNFDFAIVKAHGTTTEYTTADKQRRDSTLHCDGFMSLLCGNAQSGEIIRLDRDVTWNLEPKKQEYRETHFPTAEERQEARHKAQELMEKMKQCPVAQNAAPAPNTSKCQMTPPKFEVHQGDAHASFAGHDAQLAQLALTQSCRNPDTGDTCDFLITFDAWLTQDEIAGADDRRAFRKAHLQKLGLDEEGADIARQLRQFLAPYEDSLRELGSKASALKGYPLKTTVRIAFGGEHCASAQGHAQSTGGTGGNALGDAGQAAGDAAASSAAGAAGSAAGTAAANTAGNNAGSTVLGSAASAFGSKLVSGLFNRKKADAPATGTANAPATPSSLPPGMVQAAEFSVETKSISAGPVPPAQFEIPPGWKLVIPKERPEKEFSCPRT